MKKASLLILILLLFSCNTDKKGITVTIENSTESTLKNVKVMASSESFVYFDSISPKEIKTKFLDMSKTPLNDGSYTLQFTRPNGRQVSQSDGYYTNGSPLNEAICFNVSPLTILALFDQFCD